MKIERVSIKNYRNLDNVNLYFGEQNLSFLIGENNTGKTNLLDMLDVIFNKRGFDISDFKNPENSIKIELTIILSDVEKGIFDDYCSPDNSNNKITLLVKQESPEEFIEIFHKESGEKINKSKLRYANFVKYDPLRKPTDELNFYKQKGGGKFLSYISKTHYERYQGSNSGLIDSEELDKLASEIDESLKKIEYFRRFKLKVDYEKETFNQVLRLLKIVEEDSGVEVSSTGYGVQFSLVILFHILNQFTEVLSSKYRNGFIFEKEGKNYCSIILGIDEPEIHLHPYMQRSLIKTINKILNSEDESFLQLLKEIFNIDGIVGQAIVVTHSPNILLDDYKQYIRIYRERHEVKSAPENGPIYLDNKEEKHFRRQAPYIKEAFFSKLVIVVEGDTEYGAIPEFLRKFDIDMDEYGITIIKADGVESIEPVKKVLGSFGIRCIAFADKDRSRTENDVYDIVTTNRDFEEDIAQSLSGDINEEKEKILDDILRNLGKEQAKYSIIKRGKQMMDGEELYKTLSNEKVKNIITGKIIGEKLPKEYIPDSIRRLAEKIKSILGNGHE
jgi:putative ATP-dependent endonuclease of OLD family